MPPKAAAPPVPVLDLPTSISNLASEDIEKLNLALTFILAADLKDIPKVRMMLNMCKLGVDSATQSSIAKRFQVESL